MAAHWNADLRFLGRAQRHLQGTHCDRFLSLTRCASAPRASEPVIERNRVGTHGFLVDTDSDGQRDGDEYR